MGSAPVFPARDEIIKNPGWYEGYCCAAFCLIGVYGLMDWIECPSRVFVLLLNPFASSSSLAGDYSAHGIMGPGCPQDTRVTTVQKPGPPLFHGAGHSVPVGLHQVFPHHRSLILVTTSMV